MIRNKDLINAIKSVLIAVLIFGPLVLSSKSMAAGGYSVNTKYSKFSFASKEDVRKLNSSLDFSAGKSSGGLFSKATDKEIEYELIRKVDALFTKVQRILDMRKKMKKVQVNIYPNKAGLHKAFYDLYKKECKLRGWYLYKNNTIYLNVQDVHEGMLAHEFAHAIIDHFLSVKPPRASAEILARYVDEHLFDEVKTY